jgi:hypothetical protein
MHSHRQSCTLQPAECTASPQRRNPSCLCHHRGSQAHKGIAAAAAHLFVCMHSLLVQPHGSSSSLVLQSKCQLVIRELACRFKPCFGLALQALCLQTCMAWVYRRIACSDCGTHQSKPTLRHVAISGRKSFAELCLSNQSRIDETAGGYKLRRPRVPLPSRMRQPRQCLFVARLAVAALRPLQEHFLLRCLATSGRAHARVECLQRGSRPGSVPADVPADWLSCLAWVASLTARANVLRGSNAEMAQERCCRQAKQPGRVCQSLYGGVAHDGCISVSGTFRQKCWGAVREIWLH